LRVVNKFHSEYLKANLSNFLKFIAQSLQSKRSAISKNSLILCREIFSKIESHQLENYDLSELINNVSPILILKSFSNASFIAKEAMVAFNYCITNCPTNETIQVILTSCGNRS